MPILTRAQYKLVTKSESDISMLAQSKLAPSESAPCKGSAPVTDALASALPCTIHEAYVRSPHHSRRHDTSADADTSSVHSANTIRARQLAAKAEHARRLAEIDKRAAERERAVADLELQAELAAIDMDSGSKSKSSKVQNWLVDTIHTYAQSEESFMPQAIACALPQATGCALPQATACTPPQATACAPPQATACAPPQTTACTLPQATACAPPQATACAPPQATACAPPQTTACTPPQATAYALPHATACTLPQATVYAPPQATASALSQCTACDLCQATASAPPQNTADVFPHTTSAPPLQSQVKANVVSSAAPSAQPFYLPYTTHAPNSGTHINSDDCNNYKNKTNIEGTQDSFITLANVIAELGKKNLKVCDIPKFDGRAVDWLPFKKAFIQSKLSYTASENIARLSAALHGLAKEAVAMLLVSAEDPDQIILALENRFAQPEFIVLQQLSLVRALPRLGASYEATRELNVFACRIRNCVEVIRLLKQPEYLASPELVNTIVGKLTPLLRSRWADFAATRLEFGKFKLEILADFLENEANLQVKFGFITSELTQFNKSQPGIIVKAPIKDKVYATDSSFQQKGTSAPSFSTMCKFCQAGIHEVSKCEKFALLDIDNRWQWVLDNKVCRKCLKKGSHQYRTCNKKCEVKGCMYNRRHHSLLHRTLSETTAHVDEQSLDHIAKVQSENTQSCLTNNLEQQSQPATIAHSTPLSSFSGVKPHLKVIAVTIMGPKGSIDTYALLDDGSSTTLLDQSVADLVGAQGSKGTLHINCIGGLNKEIATNFVEIKIKGRHNADTYKINVRTIRDLCISSQSVCHDVVKQYNYLNDLVDELCYDNAKPMILIGADNWHLLIPQVVRHGTRSQPAAVLTALGWVLFGFSPRHSYPAEFVNHISIAKTTENSLDAIIKEYFKLDSIGIVKKDFRNSEDQRALDILEKTTQRLPSGRFQTGLLWRDNIQFIPKSRELALSRFVSLERKFAKDKVYADSYKQNIKATIDKGYAELCSGPSSGAVTWYLPHFGVVHPHKKKLRVVHDCAAKCASVSLNSLLLSGPDLLQPLLAIVMRFREGRVAVTADIREMFPQVKIRPEDRDAQRFLWRDHPDLPIQEYRMSSMIFGATSSPCTALYLKNKNASDFQGSEFQPEAIRSIIEDHYMDDLLVSFDDDSQAARITYEVMMIHKAACFDMRAWVSNHKEALSLIPVDLHATGASEVGLGPTTCSQVRVLGLTWNVAEDSLYFVKSLPKLPVSFTKRTVLSLLMSIYDPVGFIIPIIIKGRILFQKTWKLSLDWDQVLPDALIIKWNTWFHELQNIVDISIPRCYFQATEPIKELQLHLFADASELAYACVGYWRFTLCDNSVKLSLIGGKARLAPLKSVSIPRLELQAALIAARYAVYITEAHKRKPNKIIFWSDSLTVLRWLRSDSSTFKAFVSLRVGEISEISNIKNWRYVPTTLNVADDATRDNNEFKRSSRWFTGPCFLLLPQSEWPCEPTAHVPLVTEELKRNSELVGLLVERKPLPSPEVAHPDYFSSWLRLLRATARVHLCAKTFLSFIRPNSLTPCSLRCERNLPVLSVDFMNLAERHLFWKVQLDSFADEIFRVNAARPVSNESRLKRISLIIGEDQLLKLSGRTGASSDVESHPIVLDGKHQITKLLIHFYHVKFAHANNELVVNELRQRFFIVSLRPSVRQVSQRCQFCRNRKTKPLPPPVGDLPDARMLHHERPFTYVGLDYFGPVKVTIGRRNEKRWIALFTCMTVRAVHLEIVANLSSDSAIMALRRFIARRGCPIRIYSDNGTSFVGAAKLLTELYVFTSNKKIDWRFIPPSAPFMGGCWERLVRSIKTSISITLKERAPKEEVLNTLLLEAEAIINSRPLTHVYVDSDCDHALTPFSFIIGTPSYDNLSLQEFSDDDLNRRANWRKAQRLADHLWQRFVKEYLPTLVPRGTVSPQATQLKIGDLVFIADGNLPRGCWPRGKIVAVYPGKDNIVRVVDVATKGGVLRRPVKKLALLVVSNT